VLPLLLTLALFGHLALTGQAAQTLLGLKLGRTRGWLLAPAFGLAALGLLTMVLNQAGLPFASFSRLLCLVATAGSIGALLWQRLLPPPGWGRTAAILLAVLLLSGWPLLIYGWSWVGYGNDDMTNYCLGAERFLHHGFYAIPKPAELGGTDYSQLYWMLHVAGQIRFGSEHMLAYVAGVTGLRPVAIFMPTLLAFALVQMSAVMALAGASTLGRRSATVAGIMLGAAPLWYAGTMYQLIAQVAGLGLLAATVVLIARPRFPASRGGQARLAGASALLIAALGIYYPEVLPFLVLGWGLYMGAQMGWRRRWFTGLLPTAIGALFLTFVLLRHNALSTIFTLLGQAHDGLNGQTTVARVSLFPYFLMPAGPAFFFGFDVFVARYPEPWASIALIGGFLAAVIVPVVALRRWRDLTPATALVAVMAPVGALLFFTRNGFGLFKLTMFALPFLVLMVARWTESCRHRRTMLVGYALLLTVWLPGAWRYTLSATNLKSSVAGELLNASVSRGVLPDRPAWSDTASSPVNKLLMLEAPASEPVFLSQLVAATIMGRAAEPFPPWVWRLTPGQATGATAADLVHYLQTEVYRRQQVLGLTIWARRAADRPPTATDLLVTSQAEIRSFNKLAPEPFLPTRGLFTYARTDELKNHLVFVQSREGQHYYLGAAGQIAVYRAQADIYQSQENFFAVGRHLLFRVINPGKVIRLRFAMTASILGEGRTELPHEAVVRFGADQSASLGLIGSGSANVFSPPLEPVWINHAAYVALDLGRPPLALGLPAQDLQGVYNRDLSLDTRLALGYCRDISALDDEAYQARARPREISHFPADLIGRNGAEYSGIYEDGWIAQHAYVILGPGRTGDKVVIAGNRARVPGAPDKSQEFTLLINGQPVLTRTLDYGPFTLEAVIDHNLPAVKVELKSGLAGKLPGPDNRPVSFLLQSIGLQSPP
jgi:hypothetical protein